MGTRRCAAAGRLGKAGSRQDLLIAVEFYKNTLENFPDRKEKRSPITVWPNA